MTSKVRNFLIIFTSGFLFLGVGYALTLNKGELRWNLYCFSFISALCTLNLSLHSVEKEFVYTSKTYIRFAERYIRYNRNRVTDSNDIYFQFWLRQASLFIRAAEEPGFQWAFPFGRDYKSAIDGFRQNSDSLKRLISVLESGNSKLNPDLTIEKLEALRFKNTIPR